MIDNIAIYRIKNKDTGLFSLGGAYVSNDHKYHWGPRGKIWNSRRSLNAHLAQYGYSSYTKTRHGKGIPENWMVVKQFKGVEEEFSARDFYLRKVKA